MSRKKYTKPIAEHKYEDQYPAEFPSWDEENLYVHQNCADITTDGRPLRSDGFSKCSGLVLRNRQNLDSVLCHMQEWDLNWEQTPVVARLLKRFVEASNIKLTEKDSLQELIDAASRYWNLRHFGDKGYVQAEREKFKETMKN